MSVTRSTDVLVIGSGAAGLTAALTLAGAPTGYGLVVNGAASARPSVYIDEDKLAPALSRLDALVRNEKHAGESARACLTRLDATRIIAAVQQE